MDFPSPQLAKLQTRTNSYLYTTELTSSFAKKSSEVHDSLFQYRQPVHDLKPRRSSLPDESTLGKQRLTSTTGSGLLQNFSSPDLSANRRKPVSNRLIKSFRKKKPSVESFKSYVDLDWKDENLEENESVSSPSSVFESGLSDIEPTKVNRTNVQRRTSEREAEATDNCLPRKGKPSSVLMNDKNRASACPISSETNSLLNENQVASGMLDTRRRFEKSSSARTLPQTPFKPKYGASGSSSLQIPELQRTRQSNRPDSYLLAMDAAGDKPLIPKERALRNESGFPCK